MGILSVDNIKSQLTGGGSRPSLFKVFVDFPPLPNSGLGMYKFGFMCKATQLPPSTLGVIEVPFMGRKIKVAGDRTYPEWNTTIMNDEDFAVRRALEGWADAINGASNNVRNSGVTSNPESYKTTAFIQKLGKDESILCTYKMVGCFPIDLQQIDESWETTDTIEEFECTFAYDYWTVYGATGIVGDDGSAISGSIGGNINIGGFNLGGGVSF